MSTQIEAPPVRSPRATGRPTTPAEDPPLTDEMLLRFRERAPGYDRENRFFTEDFEELRDSGYLLMAVPRELGGLGMTLAEVCREQRRLGYYAPADALAVNMHIYWTGLAADLWRAGDRSLEWLLRAAAGGADLRGRPRRDRERHPGAALHHAGGASGGGLPLLRPEALRQPHAGLELPRRPRDGH